MTSNWLDSPLATTVAFAGAASALALAFTLATSIPAHGPASRTLPPEVVLSIRFELFFTTLNLVLLLALAGIYLRLYRDLPNKYTVSLVVLSLALLLYAFTSNPFVHVLLGFRPRPNVGAFVFVPDFFISLAIVVLLYQSQT
jgi:hypothetical protein